MSGAGRDFEPDQDASVEVGRPEMVAIDDDVAATAEGGADDTGRIPGGGVDPGQDRIHPTDPDTLVICPDRAPLASTQTLHEDGGRERRGIQTEQVLIGADPHTARGRADPRLVIATLAVTAELAGSMRKTRSALSQTT
jgi:hypothetical protein